MLKTAEDNPWYGYKRIAVMCRRDGVKVSDRHADAHYLPGKRAVCCERALNEPGSFLQSRPFGS